jgi:hypothetical protein
LEGHGVEEPAVWVCDRRSQWREGRLQRVAIAIHGEGREVSRAHPTDPGASQVPLDAKSQLDRRAAAEAFQGLRVGGERRWVVLTGVAEHHECLAIEAD